MKNSLLITGSAGFLGQTIAHFFRKLDWYIAGIDIIPRDIAPLADLNLYIDAGIPSIEFDELISKIKPRHCIHCGGHASVKKSMSSPKADYYSGPSLTFEVLDSLRIHAPSCKLILVSSAAVYGNPTTLPIDELQTPHPISPYGYHKLLSEILCEEFKQIYNQHVSIVRVFSAYGPGLHKQVIWEIFNKVLSKESVLELQGTGNETRDFIFSEDVARGIYTVLMNAPMKGDIYNLSTGTEVSINELAHLILKTCGIQKEIKFDGDLRSGNPLNWNADISKIMKIGFLPSVDLSSGLNLLFQSLLSKKRM